ncbi:outer membrane protein [Pontibacter locisalis]|uniref:Outer membrane protein n=1 Tax=Pontibacter locisalis TaxID=1719035 RepID=A0ABW5IIM4_9BACT
MKLSLRCKRGLFLAVVGLSMCFVAKAQNSKFEVGAHGSAFIYQGDLTPSALGSIETTRGGFGVFGSVKMVGPLALRINLAKGSLSGDDSKYANPSWRRERNFKFNTPVTEVSAQVVWNIVNVGNFIRNVNLTPYVLGGFGNTRLNIERDFSETQFKQSAGLDEDLAHPLPNNIPVALAGGGLRYAVSPTLSVNAEASYRFASFTDYLDGFSKSGNPDKDDHYYITSLGLIYSIPQSKGNRNRRKKPTCPAYQ